MRITFLKDDQFSLDGKSTQKFHRFRTYNIPTPYARAAVQRGVAYESQVAALDISSQCDALRKREMQY